MCGMASWNLWIPMENPGFQVGVPEEVLIAAEVFQVALVVACLSALLFLVLWTRDAWLDHKARVPDLLVDPRRAPASHRVLSSRKLWRSTPGARFREAGRRALARLASSEQLPRLELIRRALVVEDLVRGRPSWLRLATPQAEVRVWVDVYLDSAVPGLERAFAETPRRAAGV